LLLVLPREGADMLLSLPTGCKRKIGAVAKKVGILPAIYQEAVDYV
jgi:hypothetical protein